MTPDNVHTAEETIEQVSHSGPSATLPFQATGDAGAQLDLSNAGSSTNPASAVEPPTQTSETNNSSFESLPEWIKGTITAVFGIGGKGGRLEGEVSDMRKWQDSLLQRELRLKEREEELAAKEQVIKNFDASWKECNKRRRQDEGGPTA
ncbi:hypothetical protein HDV00_009913 [Rhizophlyctis rosea]|nr:hypothetical protein HDV00_009913 [Rhizophlyctis rosea]